MGGGGVGQRGAASFSCMRNPLFRLAGQVEAGRTRGPRGVSAPVKEPRVICHRSRAMESRVAEVAGVVVVEDRAAIESSKQVLDH